MLIPEPGEAIQELRATTEDLRARIVALEAQARDTERELQQARETILVLRDQVAAAERDQQDLRAARARLTRFKLRGLLARIVNRG